MCHCTLTCTCMGMYMSTWRQRTASDIILRLATHPLDIGFSLVENSLIRLGWPANKLQGSAVSTPAALELQVHTSMQWV